MIERRRAPPACSVTKRAIRRESRCDVVRAGCAREVLLVTGIAGGRSVRVVVVCVALRACQGCVRPRQRIIRIDCMIKTRCRPVGGRVTSTAVMRKPELHVRGIITAREIFRVARIATGRRSREHVVDVARGTGKRRMHPGQRVARVLQMIKFGVEPAVHGMAARTCRGKAKSNVINYLRREILLVARITSRR